MPWVPVGGGAVSGSAPRRKQVCGKGQGKTGDGDEDVQRMRADSNQAAQSSGQSKSDCQAEPASGHLESVSAQSSPKASAPLSPSLRPTSLGAMKPRRMAWADMASDESESESDLLHHYPASPSSASAAQPEHEVSRDPRQALAAGPPKSESTDEQSDDWVTQILAMADHLQGLASKAPCAAEPQRFSEAVSTEASMTDVASWEASAAELVTVQGELQQVLVEKDEVDARIKQTEIDREREDALAADLAAQVAEEEASRVLQEQREASEFAEATESLEAAMAASAAAIHQAKLQAQKQNAAKEVLRQRLAAEIATAADAEAKAARKASAKEARLALPELRKRQKLSKEKADKSEAACTAARTGVAQLQSDLAAAKAAADTRATKLEARRSQLEGECSQLQQALSEPLQAEVSAAAEKDTAQKLEKELKLIKDKNNEMLSQIQKARSLRNGSKADLETVRNEIAEVKLALRRAEIESSDAVQQVFDLAEREEAVKEEVDRLNEQIQQSEQEVLNLEDAAQQDRARQAEVEASKRGLHLSRRRIEEVATVQEWRLQKAAMRLEKDQPGSSLVKHLLNRDGKGGIGLHRSSRSKKLGRGLPQGNGSDVELDSTTAASETLAEC